MTTVSLVGSTGSIGTQAVEVVTAEPRPLRGRGPRPPSARSTCWPPRPSAATRARRHRRPHAWPRSWPSSVPSGTEVLPRGRGAGRGGHARPTSWSTAWSASPGCPSPWPRSRPGRRLALANKESLIAGAPVVQRARRTPGAEIVPVDSEHCALHQCLRAGEGSPRSATPRSLASSSPRPGARSGAGPGPSWRRSAWTTRSPIRPGRWGRRSRRLVHPHEQGPRGHRGPRAVRRRLRPDRRHRAPPVDRPLDGGAGRRGHRGPALACPTCACPIGYALGFAAIGCDVPFGAIDWTRPLDARLRAAGPLVSSPASTSPYEAGRRGGSAPAWLNAANEVAVAAFLGGRHRLAGHRRGGGRDPGGLVRRADRVAADVLDADAGLATVRRPWSSACRRRHRRRRSCGRRACRPRSSSERPASPADPAGPADPSPQPGRVDPGSPANAPMSPPSCGSPLVVAAIVALFVASARPTSCS